MAGLVDEASGFFYRTFSNKVGPELFGNVELGMDFQGFLHRDYLAIHRRIVKLAVGLVARAGIVERPGVARARAVQSLQNGDIQFGRQFLRQGGKSGSHYSCADHDHIHMPAHQSPFNEAIQ